MADDIVTRLRDGLPPQSCKCVRCDAADEIERLREQVAEMLPLCEDIVIGERIRERDANDNGHRTPLGEVAANFGIDLDANEMKEAAVADDIIDRLQCTYRKGEWPCEECTFCAARAEIERLRAAGDALAEQITKPCRCVEAHDGAINETCAPCAACFDWQEARRG